MEEPSCRAAVPIDQQPMIIQREERRGASDRPRVGWGGPEVGILQDRCGLEAMDRRKLARWQREVEL